MTLENIAPRAHSIGCALPDYEKQSKTNMTSAIILLSTESNLLFVSVNRRPTKQHLPRFFFLTVTDTFCLLKLSLTIESIPLIVRELIQLTAHLSGRSNQCKNDGWDNPVVHWVKFIIRICQSEPDLPKIGKDPFTYYNSDDNNNNNNNNLNF